MILKEIDDSLWDQRQWELAQKATNPVEAYQEFVKAKADPPTKIDELPKEQQDWLRAT